MAPDVYARERAERRKALIPIKRNRRVEVGPYATFYFENYDTMLAQVQEMLHIEKGGKEQIAGELEAYNPLIPQGSELIATLMLEIDEPNAPHRGADEARRHRGERLSPDRRGENPGDADRLRGPHDRRRKDVVGALGANSLHESANLRVQDAAKT